MKKKFVHYAPDGEILADGITDEDTPPAFVPMLMVDEDIDIRGMRVNVGAKKLVRNPEFLGAENAKIAKNTKIPYEINIALKYDGEPKKPLFWDILHLLFEICIAGILCWAIYEQYH